jgi:hypothetical protein
MPVAAQKDAETFPPPPPLPGCTVSVNVALGERREPPVSEPKMDTLADPVDAPAAAVTVIVEDVPVTLAGLKDAVTPLGRPVACSVTAPEKPPLRVIVTVAVADWPC